MKILWPVSSSRKALKIAHNGGQHSALSQQYSTGVPQEAHCVLKEVVQHALTI